jgi:phosphoglycolate phosphatase
VIGPIGLFVFDLDGTLVDSRRDITDAANALLEECGGKPLDEHTIGDMVGEGAAVLVERVFAHGGTPQPPDALDRYLAIYERRLLDHTRPYPGIVEALTGLASRAALGVLTNKPFRPTLRLLEGLDLMKWFWPGAIVGGDGPWPRKPDPAGLRHLMTLVGTKPQTTMLVGDSLIDFRTARNADTRVSLVRYGFGFRDVPHSERDGNTYVIAAPSELLRL